MMWDCLNCDHENEEQEFPFGDAVFCSKCGAEHESDWDYITQDSLAFWVVRLATQPEKV